MQEEKSKPNRAVEGGPWGIAVSGQHSAISGQPVHFLTFPLSHLLTFPLSHLPFHK